ncbi:hypothetical protein [Pseudomonas sp. PNPG3]|uniref:hypothetical protein n=1 Tax=Pseudomonas sp. PNPG3 TaxID=2919497 RepID=UPI001FFC8728|nr:hypothetical protein [Pseudomonas sp. PNPG3]MCK2122099.1 hypothetical protein [Pseudomonas sp. PNPG3]
MTDHQDAAVRQLLEIYADTLECAIGPCLAGRPALMAWLDDQFLRLARLDAPDHTASELITNAYAEWLADDFADEPGRPTAPGRPYPPHPGAG